MNVFPDFDGLGPLTDFKSAIGALLTIILIVAVLMLIVCGIAWSLASSTGNYSLASKSRIGLLVAIGTAALAGGGVAWVNWLIEVGEQL